MFESHLKNFSNYFSVVGDIGQKINHLINTIDESIFGIEITLSKGVANYIIVTPPHIRLSKETALFQREYIGEDTDYQFYEGYLIKPFFLPILTDHNGLMLNYISKLATVLEKDERVFIQFLIKREYNWKEKAIDMYESYLRGNDYPSKYSIFRNIQEKVLWNITLGNFKKRDYIDEVEYKILDEGFRTQIRIGIQSNRNDRLLLKLEDVFRAYDFYNAIRFDEYNNKNVHRYIRDCVLTQHTKDQIISKQELYSLFGNHMQQNFKSIKQELIINNPIKLLPNIKRQNNIVDENIVQQIANALKRVGIIDIARVYNEEVYVGSRLTTVQFNIPQNKTITQISNKSKDISAALGIETLDIEQGDNPDTVKFLIPNQKMSIVGLRDLVDNHDFQTFSNNNDLSFVVGVDELDNPIYLSLPNLAHLGVFGTTGSGKSVFLTSLITTLALQNHSEKLNMILIDPKEVEFTSFKNFPQVSETITDVNDAILMLHLLIEEMERRYDLFNQNSSKNIQIYNKKNDKKLPYIVCVIDEYADLVMSNKDVESLIVRIAQKARASGIHLILATQRPSVDIVSGKIKANLPNMISFNLSNTSHYRTVFDKGIPYTLLGRGDGVMRITGYKKEFQRFQSPILTTDEELESNILLQIGKELSKYQNKAKSINRNIEIVEQDNEEESREEDLLFKLKSIIANTGETKVTNLRKAMEIKSETLTKLMGDLVEEGWLKKHESKAKGYELIAPEWILNEWRIKK